MRSSLKEDKDVIKKMENTSNTKKVLSCFLAILLLASSIFVISALTTTTTVSGELNRDYGNVNQEEYAYPIGPGGNSGNTYD